MVTSHRSEVAKSAAIGAPFLPSIRQNNKKTNKIATPTTVANAKHFSQKPTCLLCFTKFYWVLLGFTGFDHDLPSFTGFYLVLLGFT